MMPIKIDRRGLKGALILCSAALLFLLILQNRTATYLFLLAALLHLAFFRDPFRKIPPGNIAVSAADGLVVEIDSVNEARFLKEEAIKIGIFLSIFDPHLNRAPTAGEVKYLSYEPGKFLNVLNKESVKVNESNWIGIEQDNIRVLVRQIAGAIARRIHCDVKMGEKVEKGQKMGIICYGSRTECYFPKRLFRSTIKVGQRVKAGETILGEWL